MRSRKLLVVGLDCASPSLIFDEFRNDMPNLSKLTKSGLSGTLRSCMPPITIPAWMVMFTGKDPGQLGLYGFRHRKGTSYTDVRIAGPSLVKEPTVWEMLGEQGRESIVFAVPPSYPPQPIKGNLVSCFLTPSAKSDYTYPATLKGELEQVAGPYIPDIEFRSMDRERIREELFEALENHMAMIKYLMRTKPWDFFAFVEIGVDRVHHAFWKYHDTTHHLHEPNSKYRDTIRQYYREIDRHVGELLESVDENTYVLVASDHGVKAMRGAFCINEWLIQKGYLKLRERPKKPVSLERAEVDWGKTKAWAWGGYYSRVFLNVKGREEKGMIEPGDYERELEQIREELRRIEDPTGRIMDNIVVRPEEYFGKPKGDLSDMMVVFDNLSWRAAGTVGHRGLYLKENDTGPDDAMHDWDGVFILHDPQGELPTGATKARIEDIAPTILNLLGAPIPEEQQGKVITNVQ